MSKTPELTRDDILAQWDGWRKYIADGGGGSWPRDAFESVLDMLDEARSENVALKRRIAELEHKLGLDRIGTHDPQCWGYGRHHYECAMQEIERLRGEQK